MEPGFFGGGASRLIAESCELTEAMGLTCISTFFSASIGAIFFTTPTEVASTRRPSVSKIQTRASRQSDSNRRPADYKSFSCRVLIFYSREDLVTHLESETQEHAGGFKEP